MDEKAQKILSNIREAIPLLSDAQQDCPLAYGEGLLFQAKEVAELKARLESLQERNECK